MPLSVIHILSQQFEPFFTCDITDTKPNLSVNSLQNGYLSFVKLNFKTQSVKLFLSSLVLVLKLHRKE